jgi:hypothetical protein
VLAVGGEEVSTSVGRRRRRFRHVYRASSCSSPVCKYRSQYRFNIIDQLTFKTVASTVTTLLASQIRQATIALCQAHLIAPANGESFATLKDALLRL